MLTFPRAKFESVSSLAASLVIQLEGPLQFVLCRTRCGEVCGQHELLQDLRAFSKKKKVVSILNSKATLRGPQGASRAVSKRSNRGMMSMVGM